MLQRLHEAPATRFDQAPNPELPTEEEGRELAEDRKHPGLPRDPQSLLLLAGRIMTF